MVFSVPADTYSEVLEFVDELAKAYRIIDQKFTWRVFLTIPGQIDMELEDDMISYRIEVLLYEQGEIR